VKAALDVLESARANARVDRAIESARDAVDGLTRRRFSPQIATRYFSWPSEAFPTPWRIWLDGAELISVTTLIAGGLTISSADYFLEPANYGPPYTSIETDLDSSSSFGSSGSHQRAISVLGLFGYRDDAQTVGTLSGSLTASTSTSPSITWTALADVGIGSLLRVDDERMIVTGRSMVDTTQNVGGAGLTASNADVALTVSDGTAFSIDEPLLIESERMRVVDIAGNVLTVKRAQDGSVLATHAAGVDVYALTGVTVTRAAQGSTLAAHNSAATVTRHVPPALVRDLSLAYSINELLQESAGYARVAGSGDHQRELSGRGISTIEAEVLERHGRQILTRSV
jgi:hypothetical protein